MRLGVRTRETLLKNIVSSYASDVVVPGTKLKSCESSPGCEVAQGASPFLTLHPSPSPHAAVARKLTIKSKSSRRRSSEVCWRM